MHLDVQPSQRNETSTSGLADMSKLALLPAAATTVVYSPQLLTDSDQMSGLPPALGLLWIALLLLTAPAVAWGLGRRGIPLKASGTVMLVGLTQVVTALILVRLDTWLEVRSGYLLAGSGEEAMSYGIGTLIGGVGGIVTAILVVYGAKFGLGRKAHPASPIQHPGAR